MKTLKDVLDLAVDFLKKHNVAQSRLSAETLLASLLNLKRIELYQYFDRPLEEEELENYRHYLKRAKDHEPIPYILGEIDFFHTRLSLTPDVLIPRQETEILLDMICKSLDGSEKKVLDLCSGSGCLSIGLKKAHPHLDVVGVDLSDEALKVAAKNAQANGVEVTFVKSDLTKALAPSSFDVVICNPPYITDEEYLTLDPSVKNYEPKMALVAGSSGYEFFERLKTELPLFLKKGAKVFFEMGTVQGERVKSLFSGPPWAEGQVKHDWAGHERFFFLRTT